MRASACDLRHRLTLQQEVRTADCAGGYTPSWSDVATVWAQVEPLKGAERLHAMQLQDTVSHRVTIRYRAGVTAALRLLFGTRVFNIRAVINPGERNRWLELMCEEGVAV